MCGLALLCFATFHNAMPFDPTKPANATKVVAAELRSQFNGLKDLIDAIPAGPEGPVGPAFSNVQIGSVMTGTPGSPAGAQVDVLGNSVTISFTIPAGDAGQAGEVSNSVLASEIAGTARNPASVAMLAGGISNPPTQAEIQALQDKINEMLAAMQR